MDWFDWIDLIILIDLTPPLIVLTLSHLSFSFQGNAGTGVPFHRPLSGQFGLRFVHGWNGSSVLLGTGRQSLEQDQRHV